MADTGPLQPVEMELDLVGYRQAWAEKIWAGAEPGSLADKHSHSLVVSTELLPITERAVFNVVKQT